MPFTLGLPRTRHPISETGRVTTLAVAYQNVATWTVTALRRGSLEEVSMVSDTPATAQWRLTISGIELFTDRLFQTSLSIPYNGVRLEPGQTVVLDVRSDGAVTIVADGSIAGKET